ncbi:putative sterile alpha motif domain-containing protein [Helianthus annuus]|nr:putative sterile alpha motif domain-containing protein [Helianthus annuus]
MIVRFLSNTSLVQAETVDSFLQSLGLEKYSITFQAEEVDMTALLHMTDEDLKAIGIPMVSFFLFYVSFEHSC